MAWWIDVQAGKGTTGSRTLVDRSWVGEDGDGWTWGSIGAEDERQEDAERNYEGDGVRRWEVLQLPGERDSVVTRSNMNVQEGPFVFHKKSYYRRERDLTLWETEE